MARRPLLRAYPIPEASKVNCHPRKDGLKMNEVKVKKRGWVKNAAIIFLSVMLVLTFFSNTIMNHSLPEVAAQYTQSGTISATVRGSGNIEAVESYAVKSEQTRMVLSVPVKLGDKVSVGDTLLIYGEAGSEELKAAQDSLDTLVLSYQKALVNSVSGKYSAQKAAVTAAQNSLNEAKAKRDSNVVSIVDIANAASKVESCKSTLTSAQNALEAIGPLEYPSEGDKTLLTAWNLAKLDLADKTKLYQVDKTKFDDAVKVKYGTVNEYYSEQLAAEYSAEADGTDKKNQYIAYTQITQATKAEKAAQLAYQNSGEKGNVAEYTARKNAVTNAENNLAAAESAQKSILDKKASYDAALSEVTTCQKALQDALLALEKDTALESLDLTSMKKQISEQNKIISDLKGGGDSSSVTSKVNGVVTTINVTAGDTTAADNDLMVVEVPDRGYKVSFSVTKEQSKKLTVGDTGEIQYNYWGNPITARLTAIRTDPQNPSTNKMLDFSIEGDSVESGSQVTIAIGEKSANYDVTIPNSAIRSDSNGKFVLAVVAKNTPLGNRYIATRVDIEVLASDDVNSAVSGALLSGDFVITTSTKPVEAGTQVRLSDQVSQ